MRIVRTGKRQLETGDIVRNGAPAIPHPVRTEIAGEARPTSPKTPSELSGTRRELRAARAQCPTPEGLEAAVAKRDDASREVATFVFLWVLCKCLWVVPVLPSRIVVSVAVCWSSQ